MSELSQTIKEFADKLRHSSAEEVAVDLLKQAGVDETEARYHVAQDAMEKEAYNVLARKGVDHEDALKLIKSANIDLKSITSFSIEPVVDPMIDVLEKAASYIEFLENEIQGKDDALEKAAEEIEEVRGMIPVVGEYEPEAIVKFASSGRFTNEDLEALKAVPEDTLNKMASNFDEPAWSIGGASGHSDGSDLDPLARFLMGEN